MALWVGFEFHLSLFPVTLLTRWNILCRTDDAKIALSGSDFNVMLAGKQT